MARVTSSYPAPVHGVSTLAPRNRGKGQASVQENMRSDPVSKLTRRPPVEWIKELDNNWTDGGGKIHSYRRRDSNFTIIVKSDGTVKGFVNDVEKAVTGNLASYVSAASNLVIKNVNDTTFVVDKTKVIGMTAATDAANVEAVSYINMTAALNYAETISVDVKKQSGAVTTVTHIVPDLGDPPQYDAADKARATKKVAEELATKITAIAGVTAKSKGSTVAVWEDAYPNNFIHLQVETGQGDRSAVVFNGSVQNVDGIPLYAVHGSVLKVQPNPESGAGTYYLKAVATDPAAVVAATPAARIVQEVTWVETRSPDQPYALDDTTMPHTVIYNVATDDFTAGIPVVGWDDRLVGDDDSVRKPSFVGNTIDDVQFVQKRLVFLSDSNVVMSKTGDIFDFWKRTAVKTLATDPIDITSTAVGVDSLKFMLPHNKDLLCMSANAQFKVPAEDILSPTTASITLTTRFNAQVSTAPVAMGNSVFFPTTYGDSSGIHEYKAEDYIDQDQGFQITHHVIGYMPGSMEMLVASPNLELLVVKVSGRPNNELFIYEQFTLNREKTQMAWSKWILSDHDNIQHIEFIQDKLRVYTFDAGKLYVKELQLYARASASNTDTIYLDDKITLTTTDGVTATLPAGYVVDAEAEAYIGTVGTRYPLFKVNFTVNGSTITLAEDIRAAGSNSAEFHLGTRFVSKYRPTRPFIYDDKDIADTEDNLRIHAFTASVVDTNELRMMIFSPYSGNKDIERNARTLGYSGNKVGVIPFETRDWSYPYKQRASLAEAEFWIDGPYNATIASIRWEGQLHRSSRRI